jgi:hypothetical protein
MVTSAKLFLFLFFQGEISRPVKCELQKQAVIFADTRNRIVSNLLVFVDNNADSHFIDPPRDDKCRRS